MEDGGPGRVGAHVQDLVEEELGAQGGNVMTQLLLMGVATVLVTE